jgi:hypothetical protein
MAADMVVVKAAMLDLQNISFNEFATNIGVAAAVSAAGTELQNELLDVTAAKDLATNTRVDRLVKDLAGFDATRTAVAELARDK